MKKYIHKISPELANQLNDRYRRYVKKRNQKKSLTDKQRGEAK